MPPATVDDSSVISESRRISVNSRDGGLCVLCGMDPVDVGHIISRKSGEQHLVDWIRGVAPSLSNFRKDDAANLICLCPTHHRQYDMGHFVLVPSKQQRELLLEHEHHDFAMREGILAQGGGDPGRTFPPLIDEFEYIPVQGDPFRMHIHNPTPYDPSIFAFDNNNHRPCPLLHFRASHIALMVEAEPHLSSVARLKSVKGDIAEPQIATLLRLYRRQPDRCYLKPSISVPSNYNSFCIQLEQPNSQLSARILTASGSQPVTNTEPPCSILFTDGPMPGLTLSSLPSIDDLSQGKDAEYSGADIQLAEYAKERSITWEDLKNRQPLFAGEELGHWRFASADEICRSRQLS